ncbi:hypothetical protein PPSIR1_26298 [Plesiocystis pacifica SIR-1]|uniref:BD-FAE-like domain-containing protein n=1 Tax=Plesiocystis pacifica SIR-1 TaxID=391625 RepID=A6G9X0_9BACT|nr:alpha/beta hydrolase [Plesiocystis pacifica]EDM77295.1 hypothetical protein PPSIR1_26298 [Plesiocystis pacifica SIR-1]
MGDEAGSTSAESSSDSSGEADSSGETTSTSSTSAGSSDAETDTGETEPVELSVVVTELDYGEHGESLDLYTPEPARLGPLPTLVLAHGGLWQGGSKGELAVTCEQVVLASQGAVACASLDYRLSGALGGQCQGGPDVYREQVEDFAAAVAELQQGADEHGLDPAAMVVGGHSAGAHLAALLYLRTPTFGPQLAHPPAGLAGFEGIYDVEAWDLYDDDFWNGQFSCATRRAFGSAPGEPMTCTDAELGLPCWRVGSPTFLALNPVDVGLPPVDADALLIHSPQDNWVDDAEAHKLGAALEGVAEPGVAVSVVTNGDCGTGRHSEVLGSPALAECLANFVAGI